MLSIERVAVSPTEEAFQQLVKGLSANGIFAKDEANVVAGCITGLSGGEPFAVGSFLSPKNGFSLCSGEVAVGFGDLNGDSEKIVMTFAPNSFRFRRFGGEDTLEWKIPSPLVEVLAARLENPPEDTYLFRFKNGMELQMERRASGRINVWRTN